MRDECFAGSFIFWTVDLSHYRSHLNNYRTCHYSDSKPLGFRSMAVRSGMPFYACLLTVASWCLHPSLNTLYTPQSGPISTIKQFLVYIPHYWHNVNPLSLHQCRFLSMTQCAVNSWVHLLFIVCCRSLAAARNFLKSQSSPREFAFAFCKTHLADLYYVVSRSHIAVRITWAAKWPKRSTCSYKQLTVAWQPGPPVLLNNVDLG